ncbi:MAG: hypothetical protein HDR88_04530 [Bacteroides sp.]|nr:hypothetical protein [Bacteroides sp.]
MKKFFVFCFLLSSLLMACTSSHQPNDPTSPPTSQIYDLYEKAKAAEASQLDAAYGLLSSKTRTGDAGISGKEFMSYVLSLTKEQVDSLSAIYCTEEMTEARQNLYFYTIETLTDMTSVMMLNVYFHSLRSIYQQVVILLKN